MSLNSLSYEQTDVITEVRDLDALGNKAIFDQINVKDYGAVGDGVTDNRAALQEVFDTGATTIYIPDGTYKIINATTTLEGTDVEKRADAVANSTMYAISCSTNNLTVIIDGDIEATSMLDNVFEFSGNNVTIKGSGSITGSGDFLDTNSADPLLQWHPSLIKLSGDNSSVSGISLVDPPTDAIYVDGSKACISNCRFSGGDITHGSGTVSFYINLVLGSEQNIIQGNHFIGTAYSAVFSVAGNSTITNNVMEGLLEHGVYNYGDNSIISNNQIKGSDDPAAGIQSFASGCIIEGNELIDALGISISGSNNKVVNNHVDGGSFSFRRYTGDATSSNYINLLVSGNTFVNVNTLERPIDINADCNLSGVTVRDNYFSGGITTSSAIKVAVYGSEYTLNDILIENNKGVADGTYGIELTWADNVTIRNTNITGMSSSKYYYPNSTNVTIDGQETGTWDAGFETTTGSMTPNAAFTTMAYTKIGRVVHITGNLAVGSISGAGGALKITNLPFTCHNGTDYSGASAVSLYVSNATSSLTDVMGQISEDTDYILISRYLDGVVGNAATYVQVGTVFSISGTYFTDD